MLSSTSRGLSLAVLITSVSAAFSPSAKNNVAVYWGQGPNQQRLLETCKNSAVDIVNIGFVNAFPDNSPGAYPGTNFGNACGDETYTVNGVSTLLKSSCPLIGSDIIECQNTYGKKIFLSFGGAYPQTYYIANDNSANSFADFVWGAFGPSTSAWTSAGKPRPFGNAVVDGFDFDIESNMTSPPKDSSGNSITDYKSRGYATMINRLKNTQFPKDASKSYYISGAPQCPLPDEHLAGPIANAWFDMLFVQFYNNPSCSGRAAINYAAGDSFLKWTQTPSKNSNVKIYFGLPASTSAVAPANVGDYLTQPEVKDIVTRFSPNAKWGGIMLWESTYARSNLVCGKDYTTWSKDIVTAVTSGQTIDTDISKCSTIPSPIQPGVISTCNKYEKTNPGGAKCDKFAARIGVSTAQLYAWNSVLGPNGENCGTKFVGDTYYCVYPGRHHALLHQVREGQCWRILLCVRQPRWNHHFPTLRLELCSGQQWPELRSFVLGRHLLLCCCFSKLPCPRDAANYHWRCAGSWRYPIRHHFDLLEVLEGKRRWHLSSLRQPCWYLDSPVVRVELCVG
jgi:chitinase